jgi:hypothetical protein
MGNLYTNVENMSLENQRILALEFKLWSQDIKVNKKCTNDINVKILNMVTG